MGANDPFKFLDMSNPCHKAVTNLLSFARSVNQAVHGKRLSTFTFVQDAGVDAVQALLADQDTTVPLLDEWTRSSSMGCRGIVIADGYHDFPSHIHDKLDGAAMYRQFNVPGTHRISLPPLAMAFPPSGVVLTVNEPHGEDYINFYSGVRDAP